MVVNSVVQLLITLLIFFSGTFLGRYALKSGFVSDGVYNVALKLLTNVCIPLFLFTNIVFSNLTDVLSATFLAAYFLPLIIICILLYILFKDKKLLPEILFSSIYSNTLYIGLPIIFILRGSEAIIYTVPVLLANSFCVFTIYFVSISLFRGIRVDNGADVHKLHHDKESKGTKFKGFMLLLQQQCLQVIKNPIVVSLYLGLIANLFLTPFPEVKAFFNVALPPVIPFVIFVVSALVLGGGLGKLTFKGLLKIDSSVIVKLFILPSAVFFLCEFVFKLSVDATISLVLLSACPLGINAFYIVTRCEQAKTFIGTAVLQSSLCSLLSLSFWVVFLESLIG